MSQINRITTQRAYRFVFTVESGAERRKICQLGFNKRDGSLMVSWPYYKSSNGILSAGTLPSGAYQNLDIDVSAKAKVTSHHVKYSHHPDGLALFSQDAKVFSAIRNKSVPLPLANRHVFSVMAQGLEDYNKVEVNRGAREITEQRTVLNFQLEEKQPAAIKILGYVYTADKFSAREGKNLGPHVTLQKPNGQILSGFIVAAPDAVPLSDLVVLITCEIIPLFIVADAPSGLVFIGSFDNRPVVGDLSTPLGFLYATYPAKNYGDMRRKLGTVDLRESDIGMEYN
jgi:hypothetical protein